MMCCIIAAFLFAQAMAMLRRWGIYWGFVRAGPGEEELPTLLHSIRRQFSRPVLRWAIVAVAILEMGGVGTWIYVDHGEHIAQVVNGASQSPTSKTADLAICGAPERDLSITFAQANFSLISDATR